MAVEIYCRNLKSILYRGLSEEAQLKYEASENARKAQQFQDSKRWYKKNWEETHGPGEIVLDHWIMMVSANWITNYRLGGFMGSILPLFCRNLMACYHILMEPNKPRSLKNEMEDARLAMKNTRKQPTDLVDVNTVEVLTEASDLECG